MKLKTAILAAIVAYLGLHILFKGDSVADRTFNAPPATIVLDSNQAGPHLGGQ